MKNKMVLLFALLPICLFGQRFEGSSNLNLNFKAGTGIGGGIEYENLFKNNISYYAGLSFLMNNTETVKVAGKPLVCKFNDFWVEVGGKYYFSQYSNFIPFIGISAFAGYEQFNNKQIITESMVYERGDKYLYGGGGSVGFEYNLGKISFVLTAESKFDFGQRNLYILGGGGIKIYVF